MCAGELIGCPALLNDVCMMVPPRGHIGYSTDTVCNNVAGIENMYKRCVGRMVFNLLFHCWSQNAKNIYYKYII